MIKIDQVEPIHGIKMALSSIQATHLENVLGNGQLLARIKAIHSPSKLHQRIKSYIEDNLNQIIVGDPVQLQNKITYFDKQGWHKSIFSLGRRGTVRLTQFGDAILRAFGYDSAFRTVRHKGIWLAEQLNLKTCPYCNAQYTLTIRRPDKKVAARFQFDHFFSKRRYPYLSLSLYNLIPSCASCNLNKGSRDFRLDSHYHPYHSSMDAKSIFKFKNIETLEALLSGKIDRHAIQIHFAAKIINYEMQVKAHNEIFDINSIYESHSDIAQELLIKAIHYNQSTREEHLQLKSLFPDEETYYRYLLGNYPYRESILKRPLAKFVQDLAAQLKLI